MAADFDAIARYVRSTAGIPREQTVGKLHDRFKRYHTDRHEKVPAGRLKFYDWFDKPEPRSVTAQIVLCLPGLAALLDVTEFELLRTGKLLPEESSMSMALATAAQEMRATVDRASQVLASAALSTAGEAVVVDRILQHGLDFRVEVWPVVRGRHNPMHLRSWIILKPVETNPSRRRATARSVQALDESQQRSHIRAAIVTEGLWRSLGLRWRIPAPLEWTRTEGHGDEPLFLELPVEERNREPRKEPKSGRPWPDMSVRKILVLGGMWSHVEPFSALLADALDWGRHDLRYRGFDDTDLPAQLIDFCREQLAEGPERCVWGIAENADFTRRISPAVVRAATDHLVVHIVLGKGARAMAAKAWHEDPSTIDESAEAVDALVREVNATQPVVVVEIADTDLVQLGEDEPDRDRLVDQIWYAAAEVLEVLAERAGGPWIDEWGEQFDSLRTPSQHVTMLPRRRPAVKWHEPGRL